MSGISDLYQEILLDHNNKPRNYRKPDGATHSVHGDNPLCGDKITLYLTVADGVITDAGFQGSGCAISKASASMLTQSVKGQNSARAMEIFEAFRRMMTEPDAALDYDTLGDLECLSGVAEFPTRIKCAVLAWHAMRSALEGQGDTVTSE
tara:strand:+ start:6807 stop:7256 length:450 start_codon:yes stop_codon:yes gene_type:complete